MGNTTIQSEQIADDAITTGKIADQGTDGQILTSTGSGVAWETPAAAGLDKFNVHGAISNRWYSGLYETSIGSNTNLGTTAVYYLPFIVWEDCTIDEFISYINGGTGVSGDQLQIAIYGPLTTSYTAAHIVTSSMIPVNSGYGAGFTITARDFTKGIYFYAMAANTSSLSVRNFSSPKTFVNYMAGSAGAVQVGGLYAADWGANTVNTWPHTFQSSLSFGGSSHHSADAPIFQYHVQ